MREMLSILKPESWQTSPQDRCLHHIFEEQATRNPDAIALIFEQEQVSYRELDHRAHVVASTLQAYGVTAETLVGLCVERSVEMIVGILGILKAGGVYVPLDPTYPKERLAFMIQDSQLPVLLTQQRVLERVHGYPGKVVCLDNAASYRLDAERSYPRNQVVSENLAYVIYTSGSTGQPKGVCCTHGNVLNLLADFQQRQPLGIGDSCSLWTSFNFDVSIYELFSALLIGATLHLVPEQTRLQADLFFSWLGSQHITSAYIPPFMLPGFRDWLKTDPSRYALKRLLVGVEPIPEQLLQEIEMLQPNLHIINGYGPTETTVCSTLYSVPPQPVHVRNTPIGIPVQNTKIYILDDRMSPVPPGSTGELYIGGEGVARGYWHRADLTADRFLPNPLSTAGERVYKTGDLARYLPDGNIEFIGRRDNQIKLRGFRIEMGEIEAQLSLHENVEMSVVVAREDTPGEKRLVAYVVAREGATLTSSDLRRALLEKLPEYMVPAVFIFLSALPLTSNGKFDRSALLEPAQYHIDAGDTFVPPQNAIEEALAQIWASVLNLKQVSVRTSFLELGGNSLALTRIVARISKLFQIQLSVDRLFGHITLTEVATLLVEHEPSPGHAQKVAEMIRKVKTMSPKEKQKLLNRK